MAYEETKFERVAGTLIIFATLKPNIMRKTNIALVVKNIELLISKNVLQLITEKYLAIMPESLWKEFDDSKKQTTVMRNLRMYCQLKNAHTGKEVEKQKLQLCIKNADQKVIALYELHEDKIMKKDLEPLLSE